MMKGKRYVDFSWAPEFEHFCDFYKEVTKGTKGVDR
jgi:hypothetical protein